MYGGLLSKRGAQVGDPSYFPGKVRRTSSVVRAVCLLSHPIPATNNAASVQIILPQKQARTARLLSIPEQYSVAARTLLPSFAVSAVCLSEVCLHLAHWEVRPEHPASPAIC